MDTFFKNTNIRSTPDMIDYIYECYDINGNGLIDYSEFIAACIDTKVKDMEKYIRQIFRQLDAVASSQPEQRWSSNNSGAVRGVQHQCPVLGELFCC